MSFFQVLLRAHAQEKQDGIPSLVWAPLLFHTTSMLLHSHLGSDLDPIIIQKNDTNWGDCTENFGKISNHNFG